MQTKIFWINNDESGRIGIMPRPRGGDWLADEICSLRDSGADVLVSLLEIEEIKELELEEEERLCEAQRIQYLSFPIEDRNVPLSRQETERFIEKLAELASKGKKIVIHCRQGVGRSSIIAACLLAEKGMSVDKAFERITQARGCPVPDTQKQREWIMEFIYDNFSTT